MQRDCPVGSVVIGPAHPLAIIAGPCVLESLDLGLKIGEAVRDACRREGLSYIFKASFDKANRSSIHSARGPGLEQGVAWLSEIGRRLGVPTTTDIHEPAQAAPVAKAIDLLQIPAFLCRQTDLLQAAAVAARTHSRAVNVKKGQFLAPRAMAGAVRKLTEAGCDRIILTERGTTFGYGRLVNDFLGLGDMMDLSTPGGSPPVCFDVTHSTQTPAENDTTGGRPDRAPLLARAATAAGVHALFIETHPEPAKAMSDASTMLALDTIPSLLAAIAKIHRATRG